MTGWHGYGFLKHEWAGGWEVCVTGSGGFKVLLELCMYVGAGGGLCDWLGRLSDSVMCTKRVYAQYVTLSLPFHYLQRVSHTIFK